MNRTLLLCALLVALTSGAILAGLAPAHLDVLGAFRAPNPCFGSGQYCDDDLAPFRWTPGLCHIRSGV